MTPHSRAAAELLARLRNLKLAPCSRAAAVAARRAEAAELIEALAYLARADHEANMFSTLGSEIRAAVQEHVR